MKLIPLVVLPAAAAWICGCAFNRPPVVVDTVGPPPQASSGGAQGTLMVYSAYDPNADFNDMPYLSRFTDYTLLSSQGKVLQVVHNNTGGVIEQPARVALPAGEYRVVARANGYHTVTVPVVILRDRVTTVRLDGSASWPNNAALLESNPVRLPKGEIVGWRANPGVTVAPTGVVPGVTVAPTGVVPAVTVAPAGVVSPPGVVSPSAFSRAP